MVMLFIKFEKTNLLVVPRAPRGFGNVITLRQINLQAARLRKTELIELKGRDVDRS